MSGSVLGGPASLELSPGRHPRPRPRRPPGSPGGLGPARPGRRLVSGRPEVAGGPRPKGAPDSWSRTARRASPGSMKDRHLLRTRPGDVLAGLGLAARAVGATRGRPLLEEGVRAGGGGRARGARRRRRRPASPSASSTGTTATSRARRRPFSRCWRAGAPGRGPSHPSPRPWASRDGPPSSTTSRPWPACPGPSPTPRATVGRRRPSSRSGATCPGPGSYEVRLGTTLREVIAALGGGDPRHGRVRLPRRAFVATAGRRQADTPLDPDALRAAASSPGHRRAARGLAGSPARSTSRSRWPRSSSASPAASARPACAGPRACTRSRAPSSQGQARARDLGDVAEVSGFMAMHGYCAHCRAAAASVGGLLHRSTPRGEWTPAPGRRLGSPPPLPSPGTLRPLRPRLAPARRPSRRGSRVTAVFFLFLFHLSLGLLVALCLVPAPRGRPLLQAVRGLGGAHDHGGPGPAVAAVRRRRRPRPCSRAMRRSCSCALAFLVSDHRLEPGLALRLAAGPRPAALAGHRRRAPARSWPRPAGPSSWRPTPARRCCWGRPPGPWSSATTTWSSSTCRSARCGASPCCSWWPSACARWWSGVALLRDRGRGPADGGPRGGRRLQPRRRVRVDAPALRHRGPAVPRLLHLADGGDPLHPVGHRHPLRAALPGARGRAAGQAPARRSRACPSDARPRDRVHLPGLRARGHERPRRPGALRALRGRRWPSTCRPAIAARSRSTAAPAARASRCTSSATSTRGPASPS